jgi:hypothetical protein
MSVNYLIEFIIFLNFYGIYYLESELPDNKSLFFALKIFMVLEKSKSFNL